LERIGEQDLQRLDLPRAAQEEAQTWRNLVPPDPWLPAVTANPSGFADWVSTRMQMGARNASSTLVNTRKAGQGVRPVAIVGIGERIAYRAITNFVLSDIAPPSRSSEDYKSFASGPISYAYDGPSGMHRLGDAKLSHVVEADVAAFYQYIDHEILRHELELQTGNIREIAWLVGLLNEIQGATFGLPQLLDPSDALSEIYIQILERDVVRQGLLAWRYNDDIRIGVNAYDEAQGAVERLSDAARKLGLVLNEQKTFISRFLTYLARYIDTPIDDDDAQINPADADIWVDGYPDIDDSEARDAARHTLSLIRSAPDGDGQIDLRALDAQQLRQLRRAINAVTRFRDEAAIGRLVSLFLYTPVLTPRLCEYMVAMVESSPSPIADVWDVLTREHDHSLSEWQRLWLAYVARESNLLVQAPTRVEWLRRQVAKRQGMLLHAEASLALATASAIAFADLDEALRAQPEPLVPWYVLGMRELSRVGVAPASRVQAVKATSPLYRLLLDS